MQIIQHILSCTENFVYQRDLEKVLTLTRSTVSGVLMTMEKKGLIQRLADEKDQRSKRIILNDSAKEIFFCTRKKLFEINKILTKDLNAKELDYFSDILDKMKNNMINYNKK